MAPISVRAVAEDRDWSGDSEDPSEGPPFCAWLVLVPTVAGPIGPKTGEESAALSRSAGFYGKQNRLMRGKDSIPIFRQHSET